VSIFTGTNQDMPRWIPRFLLLCLGLVFAALLMLWAFERLTSFIGTIVVALFVSFALEPAVNWLARRGLKRGLATFLVMIGAVLAVTLFMAAMAPVVVRQIQALVEATPHWVDKIDPTLRKWFGVRISERSASGQSSELAGKIAQYGANLAGNVLGLATNVIGIVFQLFTVALFAFYFVADGPRIRRALCSRLKPEVQERVLTAWEVAIDKTGGYLYSRTLLALCSAVATYVVLRIVKVPFALPLALWMGVVSQFIPTVGTYIAAAVPILVALLTSSTAVIVLLIFVIVYQQIENYLLAPHITATTMALHPAVAFGSVIVGAALFGAMGAFLAIPGSAVLQAVIGSALTRYDVLERDLTKDLPLGGHREHERTTSAPKKPFWTRTKNRSRPPASK
jgi:predicted PurR-regulated permease PerM